MSKVHEELQRAIRSSAEEMKRALEERELRLKEKTAAEVGFLMACEEATVGQLADWFRGYILGGGRLSHVSATNVDTKVYVLTKSTHPDGSRVDITKLYRPHHVRLLVPEGLDHLIRRPKDLGDIIVYRMRGFKIASGMSREARTIPISVVEYLLREQG